MQQRAPRGWLGTSAGVFSLHDSDRHCGSYLSVDDAAEILQVSTASLDKLPTVTHGRTRYLTDRQLGRAWASGEIESPRSRLQKGNAMVSFDELILLRIMEVCLPGAHFEPQFRAGNKLVDFRVSFGSKSILLEFFGPYHFIQRSSRLPMHPKLRARVLEDATGLECVIWPYWAQRCASNAKALFDRSVEGIGSVWSTSAHFGDFVFSDSAQMIQDINARLNISRPDGVGYIYTDEVVNKPIHPVVRRIREGRESASKLIPPGWDGTPRYWLPKSLWSVVGAT